MRRLAIAVRGLLRSGDTNELTAWIQPGEAMQHLLCSALHRTSGQDLDAVE